MTDVVGYKKRYVAVTARTDEEGRMRPLSVQWYNGRTYPIDKVIRVSNDAPKRVVSGADLCFQVSIGGKETRIWFERHWTRWYVVENVYDCAPC